ncbi:MAG: Do family serine endopeptidase [Micavibrio sp.]|nr:Do family serine endopeptidase [Micavibrio sp.]
MSIRLYFLFPVLCLTLALPALAQGDIAVPQSREQVQLSFSPVVKKTLPAVVNVYTKRTVSGYAHPFANDPFFAPFFGRGQFGGRMRKQIESALGSGVIIDAGGIVVTNAHVIREAEEITIALSDGREFPAEVMIRDDASDLGLLKVKTDVKLPFVNLKPSEALEVGDLVLAIGNPFGVGQTVTSGIISAQGRSSLDINDFNFFIQTDAAINPGNSGGALVALDGGVVGINTAIYSRNGGSMGLGFAIPSEMVASVLAAAKSGQSGRSGIIRPWLGVDTQNVTSDIAESLALGTPRGALVKALHSASPMAEAGIKVGDVILSVNGRDIRDAAEMKFRMATVSIGGSADVKVVRAGKEKILAVKAIAPPDEPSREAITLKGKHILQGVSIANINPAVAVELGLQGDEDGVVVMDVPQNSYAGRIVEAGDILMEINGVEIKGPSDVEKALARQTQALVLKINSGGRIQQIVLR